MLDLRYERGTAAEGLSGGTGRRWQGPVWFLSLGVQGRVGWDGGEGGEGLGEDGEDSGLYGILYRCGCG